VLATYNLAKGKDVPFVVGLLPAARQVRKAVRQTKSSDGEGGLPGCRIGQSAECQPQKRIKTFLSAHGIAYIDALPYVVANDWRASYLRRDGHPTAAGNERFAQAYFDYLTNQWHVLAKLQPN